MTEKEARGKINLVTSLCDKGCRLRSDRYDAALRILKDFDSSARLTPDWCFLAEFAPDHYSKIVAVWRDEGKLWLAVQDPKGRLLAPIPHDLVEVAS